MTEELIDKKTITYGDDFIAEMELSYFLIRSDADVQKKYGVRITKETIENRAHISEDNATDFIFFSASSALTFLKMLIKYEVTPIALSAVLEDYLCDYEIITSVLTA